jgi:hypothetical protein
MTLCSIHVVSGKSGDDPRCAWGGAESGPVALGANKTEPSLKVVAGHRAVSQGRHPADHDALSREG